MFRSIVGSSDSFIAVPAVTKHVRQMASKLTSVFCRIANPGWGEDVIIQPLLAK